MKFLLLASLFLITAMALYAQQPGTLDPIFGNKGTFTDPGVATVVGKRAMKVTRDGRILIGTGGPYKGFNVTFKIDAYLPNGSHDVSFGENGSAYVLFPDMKTPQDNATIGSLALLPDGRILACGSRYNFIFYGYVAFAGFKPDGTVDSTFGTNGTSVDSVSFIDHGASSVALQPDGKIVTAGGATTYGNNGQPITQVCAARYLPNGNTNKSFGYGGLPQAMAVNPA